MEVSASSFSLGAFRRKLSKKLARRTILALVLGCGLTTSSTLLANVYNVTNGNNSGVGSLRQALIDANGAGAGPHTINVDNAVNNINVTTDLPWVNTNVTIEGNTTTITGNNHRLFFVNAGTVNLRNMDLTGGRAAGGQGGDGAGGGGGGLGAGGGLFVNAGANVTIQGVTFDGNQASGGNGGAVNAILGGGGGGGLGGNGGSGGTDLLAIGAGGGGGGLFGSGGDGGLGGGGGGGSLTNGGLGGVALGGIGLNGAGNGGSILNNGFDGTTNGGGGGGGLASDGGDGGVFGGGGGAGLDLLIWGNGGDGGFGAGGGGSNIFGIAGSSGFGAGVGGAGTIGSGGSGYGGAVFVRQGGSLTIVDSSATANNGVTAGLGLNNGQTGGSNLYLMAGVNTTFSGTGTSQIAGGIDGAGGIIKQGSGTLILGGTNSYTGGTTVSGGTLQGTTDSLQGNITNNANVEFNQAGNGTYAGTMSGSGSLTKTGNGTVTLTGPNTYSGGTTISGGILAGNTTSLQGDITNNANLQFDQTANGTYAGSISGTGSLVKNGNGMLTMSGTNTYSGGTTINDGGLQGTTNSLQGNFVNNGTLEFNQASNGTHTGNISGNGSVIKNGNGAVTLNGTNSYSGGTTVSGGSLQGTTNSLQGNIANNANVEFNQGFTGTYAGVMSGSGTVTKSGTGTVVFSGNNTYSGGTTVSGGTLQGTTSSLQGDIANNANVEFNQANNGTYAGTISGSGAVVKNGTGNVTLTGPNTYSGGTTVSGGTLTGTTTSIQGNVDNDATLQFDQAGNGTYAGVISGTGNVVKNGAGTVTLSGTNTYQGGTTISGGTLQGNTTSLQGNFLNNSTLEFNQANTGTFNGNITGNGNVVKNGVGTVTLNGSNNYTGGTSVNGGSLQGTTNSVQGDITNNANVEFNQSFNGTYAGAMSGNGSVNKSGTGTVIFNGPNTYTGGTTVSGGSLQGTTTSLQGNITNNANVEFNQVFSGTYAGVLSGNGSVTKSGTGTVFLSGPNTYSGGTTVSGGTLQGTTTSLQGNITNNANVEFNQANNGTYAGTITGSGSVVKNGTGNVTLTGPNTYSGGTTINGGTLTGTTTSIQGTLLNNGTLQFDQAGNGTYSGTIAGHGTVVKSGAGTVTMSGNNFYTGGTTINSGTLQGTTSSLQGNVNNNGVLEFNQAGNGTFNGNITGAGSVLKNGAGTVVLNGTNSHQGGTTVNAGTLQGNTNSLQGNLANNANVRIDQNFDGTLNGTISGTGTVVKSGNGAVTINNPQTYTGLTTIDDGTLYLNGSLAGNAQVNAYGTLGGNGTINGHLNNAGMVSPGNAGSVGTLHINGNYTGTSSSGLQIQIRNGGNTPGVHNDLVDVNGNVNLAGTLYVDTVGASLSPGTRYTFLTFSGLRNGAFDAVEDDLPLLNSVVTYGTGVAQLELVRNNTTYASLARTLNQKSLARYLDDISQNPVGDMGTVIRELSMLDASGLQNAYTQMTAQVNGTVNQLSLQNTTQVYLAMNRQFRWRRAQQVRPFNSRSSGTAQFSAESPIHLVNYEEEPEPVFTLPSTAFNPVTEGIVSGYGLNGSVEGDGSVSGADYNIAGTFFSVQRHLEEDLTVGCFGAYSDISMQLNNPAQTANVTDFQVGGNIRRSGGINYFLMAGSIGFDTYNTQRPIVFGGINRMATGYTTGYQAAAWLERGWMLQLGAWDVQPFAALQYVHLKQNGFAETGAGALNLNIADVTSDALRPILGIHTARPFYTNNGWVITPEINAMLVHELLKPETSFNSVFAGTGGASFVTNGLNYGKNWAVIGGGLSWKVNDHCTVFGNYDVQTNSVQNFQIASGGVQFVW